MNITVIGAGAFGTALAISYAKVGRNVTLVARDETTALNICETRIAPRLPHHQIPDNISVVGSAVDIPEDGPILLAIPSQKLTDALKGNETVFGDRWLIACCKGINCQTLVGPVSMIKQACPKSKAAMLTGPSFADDIARGLPTALTLASEVDDPALQEALSNPALRLYRTTDTIGAELGGALKNVIAIGAGIAIGSGLGDSARASLMTRGFKEMRELAGALGANPETLTGLSGFGDLALTCTSELSRNFCYGRDKGRGIPPDANKTVEGVATALAVRDLAKAHQLELPVCDVIAALCHDGITVDEAVKRLMTRPLKEEL